jgi:hypothetical protein
MYNHLPKAQILVTNNGINSTPMLVNEHWLTNLNVQPPPYSPDSDLERRNKLISYAGFGDVPQLIQLGARSCPQYSSMNLIKEETIQRNPNDG